jgi:hypothetical protein
MAAEPFARFTVARASDFDQAQGAMQSAFLPLRMRLLEPFRSPALDLKLNATQVGGLTVSYVRLGSGMHIDTVEAADYHVNLPLPGGTDSRPGRLERVQSTPRRAAVFLPRVPSPNPGAELEAMLDRSLSEPIVFTPAMEVRAESAGRGWTRCG